MLAVKKQRAKESGHSMSKEDLERLAQFRYRLRCYLRFSEEVTRREGITPLQYQLMLQIKGFPGREWATVGELAGRIGKGASAANRAAGKPGMDNLGEKAFDTAGSDSVAGLWPNSCG